MCSPPDLLLGVLLICGRYPTVPSILMLPLSGDKMLLSSLSRVLFPVPLFPMMATRAWFGRVKLV